MPSQRKYGNDPTPELEETIIDLETQITAHVTALEGLRATRATAIVAMRNTIGPAATLKRLRDRGVEICMTRVYHP